MRIVHGAVPTDGFIDGSRALEVKPGWRQVFPAVADGQRLTGTVTVARVVMPETYVPETGPFGDQTQFASVPMRLLVNGEPQPDWTIDTRAFPDGTHVLGVQVMDSTGAAKIYNGSRVVVFNNSGAPHQSKAGQAVVGPYYMSRRTNSGAWARVDVLDPVPAPIGHAAHYHPKPTDADRARLATAAVWWMEGLLCQGPGLYEAHPMLVKNGHGDWYVKQWQAQHATDSAGSLARVQCDPAFDGPRNVCALSTYSTLVAGRKVLASGSPGYLGVDIAGRIVDIEISGEVRTIFGPRSVAGTVQTDPNLTGFTLAQRIAAGEKELVGTGPFLTMPQDLATADDDTIVVADTGAKAVHRVSRSQRKIVSTSPRPGVTSVWVGMGAEWWACPKGLWRHDGSAATLVADIPGAFWVRGDPVRGVVYVLTDQMRLMEHDTATGATVQRLAAGFSAKIPFVFMDVDVGGTIGPRGRIYFSMVHSYDSSTGMRYADPGEWVAKKYLPQFRNLGNAWTSRQVNHDPLGHYLWGFCIHASEAQWVSFGIVNPGFKVATAHLGEQPPVNSPISFETYLRGRELFTAGRRDIDLGIGTVFGWSGGGRLGYTVDVLRSGAIADFRALIDPLLPAAYTPAERQDIAAFMWMQPARPHFLVPPPADDAHDHEPPTEPTPEPPPVDTPPAPPADPPPAPEPPASDPTLPSAATVAALVALAESLGATPDTLKAMHDGIPHRH